MFLNGLDALAQAGIICFLGILIVVSNTLIIATLLNYKGRLGQHQKLVFSACKFNSPLPRVCLWCGHLPQLITTITNRVAIAGKVEVINYYLLSLAVADLLGGLLIIPFSVYPTLSNGQVSSNLRHAKGPDLIVV